MSSLVLSLLIKEVVAAREVIANIEKTTGITSLTNPKLTTSLKNYKITCDEIRKITEERITGPMSAYEQERKTIRRYE